MEVVGNDTPTLAYGAAVSVDGKVFVHGGVATRTTNNSGVSNSCYLFDVNRQTWTEVTGRGSPTLSFHDAYVVDDRYVHLVGGWNGKARSSCLYIYDVRQSVWLNGCKTLGFPSGAGLSGHTVTKLNDGSCLITGRLGGLRTQRQHGTVMRLKPVAFPTVFRYEMISESSIQSRSGHTCTPCSNRAGCLLVGGRDRNDSLELLELDHLKLAQIESSNLTLSADPSDSTGQEALARPPSRRYHVAVPILSSSNGTDSVLLHGGENFAATARGPATDGPCFSLVSIKRGHQARVTPQFFRLELSQELEHRLTGHKAVIVDGRCFLTGGFEAQWRRNDRLFMLKLP